MGITHLPGDNKSNSKGTSTHKLEREAPGLVELGVIAVEARDGDLLGDAKRATCIKTDKGHY